MTKKKPVPEAPRAKITLRDFVERDWRWKVPVGTRIYMKRRVHVGMPEEMREAIEKTAAEKGIPMTEVGRQLFARGLFGDVKPGGK